MPTMRFSRVKIETDFRELEKTVAAATVREDLTSLSGVAGAPLGVPLIIATPKRRAVEPRSDE